MTDMETDRSKTPIVHDSDNAEYAAGDLDFSTFSRAELQRARKKRNNIVGAGKGKSVDALDDVERMDLLIFFHSVFMDRAEHKEKLCGGLKSFLVAEGSALRRVRRKVVDGEAKAFEAFLEKLSKWDGLEKMLRIGDSIKGLLEAKGSR